MSAGLLARFAPRDRRALLLGAVIAIPIFAYQLGVRPYLAVLSATREAVVQERSLLQRELTLLWRVPQNSQEIRGARAAAALYDERLLPGADAIEATSALSAYAASAVRSANAVVQQVESRDATELTMGLREVSLEMRATGNLEAILNVLHGLEAGPRLVRVTRLSVERSLQFSRSDAEALAVVATVRGYARLAE